LTPPSHGAAQLYKAVYQARRALLTAGSGVTPEAVLLVQSEELRLEAPGEVGTDVESFQALARRALEPREALRELAAAQGCHLSCSEIAFEIERGLGMLEATLRDLPLRHRSQWAAFEPSWRLLSPHEQGVFARLEVFRGGFRREAAEAVAGATLAVLSALADNSLVRRTPVGRYELHELLRQFAEEKLSASPEHKNAARQAHARYYCQYLARQEARLKGPDHQAALGEIAEELENIRVAWRWAAAGGRWTRCSPRSPRCSSRRSMGWLFKRVS
jgi:predicted ATPase